MCASSRVQRRTGIALGLLVGGWTREEGRGGAGAIASSHASSAMADREATDDDDEGNDESRKELRRRGGGIGRRAHGGVGGGVERLGNEWRQLQFDDLAPAVVVDVEEEVDACSDPGSDSLREGDLDDEALLHGLTTFLRELQSGGAMERQ